MPKLSVVLEPLFFSEAVFLLKPFFLNIYKDIYFKRAAFYTKV